MSVRIQSATAVAMAQRRMAAGFSEIRRLSGSTTASSRTRSSPPQPPAPLMSGMLGAIATASVSASRQAEGGGGAGAAGSPALSLTAAGFSGSGLAGSAVSGSALGASAGRGCGSGTDCTTARRFLGLVSPNRPLQGPCGQAPAFVAAAAGIDGTQSISSAAAVTIAAAPRRKLPQGHFRPAFSALKFMPIP